MATNIAAAKFEIEKLDDSNYATWLIQMMLILIKEGSWEYVECSKTKESFLVTEKDQTREEYLKRQLEWDAMMRNAYASIMMTLSPDILWEFVHHNDPRILMIKLKAKFRHSAGGTSKYFRRQMASTKLINYGNVNDYCHRLNRLVADIVHFGGKIQDDEILHYLTTGLPDEWDDVSRVIRSRPGPKWEWVINELRSYEDLQRFKLGLGPDADLFVNGIKNTIRRPLGDKQFQKPQFCSNCKRPGHTIDICRVPGGVQRAPAKHVSFALPGLSRGMADTQNSNSTAPRTAKAIRPSTPIVRGLHRDLLR